MKIIHLFKNEITFTDGYIKELELLGDITLYQNCRNWSEGRVIEEIKTCHILITSHDSIPVPSGIVNDPGNLLYINHLHGTIKALIPPPLVASNIVISNWGPGPAYRIARAAMTLLLAVVSDLPTRMDHVKRGGWKSTLPNMPLGHLDNSKIGIYGFGAIGKSFYKMLEPYESEVYIFDPYIQNTPPKTIRVHSLKELCEVSDILIIHAALSEDTRESINQEMLSLLPDNGIVINTARGEIIDQKALFDELESGRLRAGLDVLSGSDDTNFPIGHKLRDRNNCILTCHYLAHQGTFKQPSISRLERVSLDNIEGFINKRKVKYTFDIERYNIST